MFCLALIVINLEKRMPTKSSAKKLKKSAKRSRVSSKKSKKINQSELLLIVLAGLTLLLALLFYFFPKDPNQSDSALLVPTALALAKQEHTALPAVAPAELPLRIKIPKIKIDTALEYVGLTPEGAAGVPKNPINAAWLNLWPRPGDVGNAIITGHSGPWKNNLPTVFNNLFKLRPGDKIYIKDKKGVTTTFIVRQLRTYGEHADASDVFISNDGKAHLNLITCEGVWNKITKSYSERLVVFADKE
jgi:LPXTG-site transpeptidase (sortase) family protein